jgi:hypothetical protein
MPGARSIALHGIAIVLLGGVSVPIKAQAPQNANTPQYDDSYDGLSLQISLLQKLQADERFVLAGIPRGSEKEQIKSLYKNAGNDLTCSGVQGESREGAALRKLLCADIRYRLFLIDRDVQFWGGARTLTPQLPSVHLAEFVRLVGAYREVATWMRGENSRKEDLDLKLLDALAQEKTAQGKASASSIRVQAEEIRKTASQAKLAQFSGRLDALKAERALLQRYMAEAEAERDAAGAALGQALISALGNSVGAPEWLTSAAQGESPEQALKTAATGWIGNEIASNPALKANLDAAVSNFGTTVSELNEAYKKVDDFKGKVDAYKKDMDALGAVIRQPTAEGLAEVGTIIWNDPKFPEDTKKQFRSLVAKSSPILEASRLLSTEGELSNRVRVKTLDFLASQDSRLQFLEHSAEIYIDTKGAQANLVLGSLYDRLANDPVIGIASMTEKELTTAADSFVRVASSWFVDTMLGSLSPEHAAAVLRIARVSTQNELKQRIAANGLQSLPTLTVKEKSLVVSDGMGRVLWKQEVGAMLRFPGRGTVILTTADARGELKRAITTFSRERGSLRAHIAAIMPGEHLEAQLRRVVKQNGVAGQKAAWSAIVGQATDDASQVIEGVAASRVAAVWVNDEMARLGKGASDAIKGLPTAPKPQRSSSRGPSTEEQLAEKALEVAFPGVGTAVSLAKTVILNFFAMQSANAWLSDLRSRLEANLAAESQILDLRLEAKLSEEVASKESEYYQTLAATYNDVFRVYNFQKDNIGEIRSSATARIALRRSLAYFLSERLREEYDLFDRALSIWLGSVAAERGTIAKLIQENPQNVRLAIDPEIRLLSFLDRGEEGMKTDVDGLLVHWEKLLNIALDACTVVNCDTRIKESQIGVSPIFSLCNKLTPLDRNRARIWSQRPQDPLRLRFFLGPQDFDPSGPLFSSGRYNHRVVRLRIGAIPTTNGGSMCGDSSDSVLLTAPKRLSSPRIAHPGVAYVRKDTGRVDREQLLPYVGSTFDPPDSTRTDLEAVAERWVSKAVAGGPISKSVRKDFEGYGLFTEWEVIIDPKDAKSADIGLEVTYQFLDSANTTTEAQYYNPQELGSANPFQLRASLRSFASKIPAQGGGTEVIQVPSVNAVTIDPTTFSIVPAVAEALRLNALQSIGISSDARQVVSVLDSDATFRIERRCIPVREFAKAIENQELSRIMKAMSRSDTVDWALTKRQATAQLNDKRSAIIRRADMLWQKAGCAALERAPQLLVGQ